MKPKSLAIALCVLAVAVASLVAVFWPRVDSQRLIVEAKRSLSIQRFDDAFEKASQVPASAKEYGRAQLILGEVATRRDNDTAASLKYYALVPRDKSEEDVLARLGAAEIHLHEGRLEPAWHEIEYAWKVRPDSTHIINRMAFVLGLSGQRYESAPFGIELVRRDEFSVEMLSVIGEQSAVVGLTEDLRRKKPVEGDALLNLANGRYAIMENRLDDALLFLDAAMAQMPDLQEAHLRKAEVFLLKKDLVSFMNVVQSLPLAAEKNPEYWRILGAAAELLNDRDTAIRAYWETVRRDQNSRIACFRLAQLLPQVGLNAEAEIFAKRASILQELGTALLRIFSNNKSLPHVTLAAQYSFQLRRYWEAWGWSRVALLIDPELQWALRMRRECESFFSDDLPQTIPDPNLTRIDLSKFRLTPNSELMNVARSLAAHEATVAAAKIRFRNDTKSAGVDFTYYCSPDESTPGGRMFEFTGGGVAATDFDLDGRVDLYFVQGCHWPPAEGDDRYLDRLHRNVGGEYRDVTALASIHDAEFGQGVSAGDVDQDGFPDFYIANAHQNRLFLNNGDGTFRDATQESGLDKGPIYWTTSSMLADLNDDGFPEIFDVNYAQGEDVFHRICEQNGVTRSCLPTMFKAAPDQLWLNDGQGGFTNISTEAGIDIPEGRGLGIVSLVLDSNRGPPAIFVANDMTENYLWKRVSVDPVTRIPTFEEDGLIGGVAYGADGTSQASMGVGVADFDHNGLTDIFVTNFHNESNNIYCQRAPGVFLDEAVSSGIRDISYSLLGFGCQSLDADLDSWQDIVVTNGHVDDFRHQGTPYQMRPQLLQNLGDIKFRDLPPDEAGDFFQGEYLGRGLAVLDWNNDLKPDFCVSHLDCPSALVTNVSTAPNHSFAFSLVGKSLERSGVGSIIRVSTGSDVQTFQVHGGGGYESANDPRQIVGTGPFEEVPLVEVAWPNGILQKFEKLAAGRHYVFVQGLEHPVIIPSAR